MHISNEEYSRRRESVAAGMEAAGLDAICVFYPARVAYRVNATFRHDQHLIWNRSAQPLGEAQVHVERA